jgi:UDP-N-acetylglucosamine:LPS N-acetylglucosamine transferase
MIFRGGLFFWEGQAPILRESYRVLKAGGVAVMGGGFGAKAPNELVEARVAEIRKLKTVLLSVSAPPGMDHSKREGICPSLLI